MFARARQKRREQEIARRLYTAIVTQARTPSFYAVGGVPDTMDGRFEMIVLHTYLAVKRLMAGNDETRRLGQYVFDTMVTDMDRSLREMGVGDLSVGRKVKAMAEAYYGRSQAYDAALEAGGAALAEALERNVFGTMPEDRSSEGARIDDLANYVRAAVQELDQQSEAELAQGAIRFVEFS